MHKVGLSDLGGRGLRSWQGAGHRSAGDQLDRWGFVLSAPSWGPARRPVLQTCTKSPPGRAEVGRSFPGCPAPSWLLGPSYDLEPGPATGSQALLVCMEGGGWILACPALSECLSSLGCGWVVLHCKCPCQGGCHSERGSVRFGFVFFPILQVQLSCSWLRGTEFPSCPPDWAHLGLHSLGPWRGECLGV